MSQNDQEIELGYDLGDQKRNEDSEIVPKGQYLTEIVRGSILPAKDDKKAQILLSIKVVDSEKVENANYIGAQFIETLSLAETAGWKVAQFQDAVHGVKTTGRKLNLAALAGKRMVCRVSVETYEGRERTRVERFMHASKFRKGSGEEASTGNSAPDGNSEVSI